VTTAEKPAARTATARRTTTARIGPAVVVVAMALGHLVWHNRAETQAQAEGTASSPDPAAPAATTPTPTQDPERPV
jgi:hypothetical protein